MAVAIRVVRLSPKARLPAYMSAEAAGCDVFACLEEAISLAPGQREKIPTGLKVEIPAGYEIQVRPRSGLALKKGLTLINGPGTIDSDYRGELMVLVVNLGEKTVQIEPGDRIAQLVLMPVSRIEWQETAELSHSFRGEGGMGSTGLSAGEKEVL